MNDYYRRVQEGRRKKEYFNLHALTYFFFDLANRIVNVGSLPLSCLCFFNLRKLLAFIRYILDEFQKAVEIT